MASRSLLEMRIFSRRSFRKVALADRAARRFSRFRLGTDRHSPRSNDSRTSFSSASSFMVGRLLAKIPLRRLAARDDRLQEDELLVFNKGHKIHIVVATHHEESLTRIPLPIRVLDDVEHVAALDVEDHVLESDAALGFQLVVLRLIPGEVLHRSSSLADVCP